jgi:aminoglycoside/choline kinase family phosphotransferase
MHVPRGEDFSMLQWRLVGRGVDNPQILARDPQGGLLAINTIMAMARPDK